MITLKQIEEWLKDNYQDLHGCFLGPPVQDPDGNWMLIFNSIKAGIIFRFKIRGELDDTLSEEELEIIGQMNLANTACKGECQVEDFLIRSRDMFSIDEVNEWIVKVMNNK